MAANNKDEQGVTNNGSTSTTTTTRKNRPLRRKTSHSVIERRRREKINEGLISLQYLVPACRDELHELLLSKAQSNKRNLKRSKQEVEKEVEELLLQKIESQMVLEKLCIISHTVDYVRELQASLAAYRKLCRCSPPLDDQKGAVTTKTHKHAHLMEPEGDGELTREGSSPSKHKDGIDSSPEAEEDCIKCTISRAKRRRHWGSNHPLELAKVHAYEDLSSNLDEQRSPRQRPRRKAAPSLQTMREESIESASEDGEISAPSMQSAIVNQENDVILDDDSDDNASDLALDDWQERRQIHADNSPITPPFPASMNYTHLYHTCSLRDERHKHDIPSQSKIGMSSKSANGLLPVKPKILIKPFARSSSDGEQNHNTNSPIFNRKRRATDVNAYGDNGYVGMQNEVKRSKSNDSKSFTDVEKTTSDGEKCTDCVSQNDIVMGPTFDPFHRNTIREASPSDRLLHHSADINRLDLLANLVSRN